MLSTNVLTLNLWGTNEPYYARMTQLRRFLHESSPGILTFQEVARVNGIPQVHDVIHALDYRCFYLNTRTTPLGSDGLAICARGEMVDYRTVDLPVRRRGQPRAGQVVTIHDSAVEFTVVNTHLSYDPEDQEIRRAQVEVLLNALSRADMPLIFCGDLNEVPAGRAISEIQGNIDVGLIDAWIAVGGTLVGGATFHHKNELLDASIRDHRRYDYIFVSSQIAVEWCAVVLTGMGELGPVSDHYGVLAELSIPTPDKED